MSEQSTSPDMKTSGQDFLISLSGYATCLLTAIILWQVEVQTHFAFYLLSFWFVIPAGAIISGLVAASGYYFGALFFNQRPTRLLLVNVLLGSVATFFVIYYLEYLTTSVNGQQISGLIPFPQFLNLSIRATTLQVDAGGTDSPSTLGSWGYLYATLQVAGFALGGFLIYRVLGTRPYCAHCSLYMHKQGKQIRYAPNDDATKSAMSRIVTELSSGAMPAAVAEAKTLGHPKREKTDTLCATTVVKYCKKCQKHWTKFTVQQKAGRNWKIIGGLTGSAYADQVVTI